MDLHIYHDGDWERFCSSENNSSATASTAECRYIKIEANPPSNISEIALTKLSQIVKFSTHLSSIVLYEDSPSLHRVVSTVCEALLHSTAQQKIQFEFSLNAGILTFETFLPVADLIENCKREIGINIIGGRIQNDGASDVFADALRDMAGAVTKLKICNAGMNCEECELSENLMVNTTLTVLNLSDNWIGDKGAEALAGALKHNGALTQLDLGNNWIGKKGGVAIGHALRYNRSLEKLDFSRNAIGDEGAIALAAGLRGGSSLKELSMKNARVGKKGGVALGEALAFGPTLEVLHMNHNPIGDEGVIAVAGALVRNAALKVLWLHRIGMGTEGCSALACALRSNTALTDIEISLNRIGDEGVTVLADALEDNTSLKKLEMSHCGIGDEGSVALAKALPCNATLDSIILCNPNITEDVGVAALINGLNRNSTLTKLVLNEYHPDIEFALRRNKDLLEEVAWMKRFSDQDIRLKGTVLSKAMERYSLSEFSELVFLFLKSQVSTIAETVALAHPSTAE